MLEMFVFESVQLLDQLEEILIKNEKSDSYSSHEINEIFRIMHTIKGSSAMMLYNDISSLAHTMEDLFYFIRENKQVSLNFSELTDLILKSSDFIKIELSKVKKGEESKNDSSSLIDEIRTFLASLKIVKSLSEQTGENQKYYKGLEKLTETTVVKRLFKAVIHFEEGCKMESVRAFATIHSLKDIAEDIYYFPSNIIDEDNSDEIIRNDGFAIFIRTEHSIDIVREILMQTIFLKGIEIDELDDDKELIHKEKTQRSVLGKAIPTELKEAEKEKCTETQLKSLNQSIISVNIAKLDKLMDLVGELVIAEAMVIQNPDLKGLDLDNFQKAARQLNKITGEMQDMVMSIRMVPLAATFQKMNRIVRDMCKKLGKDVQLGIIGEDTEVDKNIIEHISDPLIHLVRNALDHGIESPEYRLSKGKPQVGNITLEAKNAGSDVLVIIKDDGKGLCKEKILNKAKEKGLLHKPEADMSNREIFNLIFLPGFSTKDLVSEFSGRGVGMDIVTKNIETVGGSVSVDSTADEGTTITLKIPLTLAIIDGMNIKVGNSRYTIPVISIKESFRPKENDIITDPDGNEMIMVRGQCYTILRLHEMYKVKACKTSILDGIIIMTQQDNKTLCIFADELIGQQQVVVKTLPEFIRKYKNIRELQDAHF